MSEICPGTFILGSLLCDLGFVCDTVDSLLVSWWLVAAACQRERTIW